MKILLLGEYSNVHWTLAEGLRMLGHKVTVISNGDFWKDYSRDINLERKHYFFGGIQYMLKLYSLLPKMVGYDVVQLINPMFLEIKAEKIFHIYNFLRKNNRKVFLGAFGMDYYWVHENITKMPLKYSDFNIGKTIRTNEDAIKERKDWIGTPKERLNKFIANDCNGIIAGLYEYWVCYNPIFPNKTVYIPFPIKEREDTIIKETDLLPIKIFIGINKPRSSYKGTDIMLKAAEDIALRFPDKITLKIAENIPFKEYRKMMIGSDAILDQLYSYTPSMNPLEAMKNGIICIGGGEEEHYQLLNEEDLRPILNVQPNYESVYNTLVWLINHYKEIPRLKTESISYIHKHHNYIKVAKEYETFYEQH